MLRILGSAVCLAVTGAAGLVALDIYYYPTLTEDLERISRSAELAYERVSAVLGYHLAFRVPLILVQTRDEFEQQTIAPGADLASVRSFAEPRRNRIVLLIEEADQLADLLAHELTHVVAFDIIPRGTESGRDTVPLWIDEGLADYVGGAWRPADLEMLRDLVEADAVPPLTTTMTDVADHPRRLVYNLGHAAFEFIEATHSKPAVNQFLFEVRRNVVDGTGDLYQAAFYQTPEEFAAAH